MAAGHKFELVLQAIKSADLTIAASYLNSIAYEKLGDAGKALYDKCIELTKADTPLVKKDPFRPTGMLQDYDNREPLPGVSIVSCCMNRNENLVRALRTWIRLPVDEIVIVDWNSIVPVAETIKEIEDPRIQVIRVNDERSWVLTYGFNVGLRFASYSKVYKFDADIEVSENFLVKNAIGKREFVRGNWKSALDKGSKSQVFVNGSFGARKSDLEAIGYYNEFIRTYGWDDSDLYERLATIQGLRTRYLSLDSVLHIEQKEEERIINQDIISSYFLEKVPPTDFNNLRNKYIARTHDYWCNEKLQNYKIVNIDKNSWECERVTKDCPLSSTLIENANTYSAMHFIWHHHPSLMRTNINDLAIADFLQKEYSTHIKFTHTLAILGEKPPEFDFLTIQAKESERDFFGRCVGLNKPCVGIILSTNYKRVVTFENGHFVSLLVLKPEMFDLINKVRKSNGAQEIPEPAWIESTTLEAKEKVFIDAQHGLGNRLRAIGSAAAIAQESGRELIIIWQPDHHCECEFSDLFDYRGKVLNKSFLGDAQGFMSVYNYMEIEPNAEKDKEIKIIEGKHLYLRSAYTLNCVLTNWEKENAFIRSLKPSKKVKQLVNTVTLAPQTLAVHVRMEAGKGLDHNTYDSIENWTNKGHEQIHFWREKSHYRNFLKRIDALIAENPNLRIFLATDLPENYDIFKNYYGDRLLYLKRNRFDRSKEQLLFALADAILLSRCGKLLGSTWSSFTELAIRLSKNFSGIEMSGQDF